MKDSSNKISESHYLSYKKEIAIVQGMSSSNKDWKYHWFWASKNWLNDTEIDSVPFGKLVENQFHAKVVWYICIVMLLVIYI